ncbi:MAG: hypothetical protein JWP89_3324 [Schlesneria sp.]|nr:hypothetical protein [Schlesneria sp.]
MNKIIPWLNSLTEVIDYPLGWLLWLPRDLSLLLFALGTALTMTLLRKRVTNQHFLHCCAADLRRLKQLKAEAKSEGDMQAIARVRSTTGQIKGIQLVADLRVLAVVLIPVAVLAMWAGERFDYIPPRIGEPLVIRAHYPASSVGKLTHILPIAELGLVSPPIQAVRSDSQSPPTGIAEWMIRLPEPGDFQITLRHQGESAFHQLRVGQWTYFAPQQQQQGERLSQTEVDLERYHPLGFDLGSQWIGLPPWMIAYVILTLVLVPVIKRVLHIA